APAANFSRTSTGAVLCERPTTRIRPVLMPTSSCHRPSARRRAVEEVEEEDEDGEAEAGDRAVRGAPPAPAGGRAQEEDDRDQRPGRVAEDRADELATD